MDVTAIAGIAVAAGVILAATAVGVWWRHGRARVRPAARSAEPDVRDLLTSLGVRTGTPATLLQFSSAFCAPCRATRLTCAQVADSTDGVRHVEVDAESHLDAVRALGVWRTPTLFVVDADGRPVSRVSGQPTREQVLDAVTPVLRQPAGRAR